MKEIIKEYVEKFEDIIKKAKEIREKSDMKIRVGEHYTPDGIEKGVDVYYYDPETREISRTIWLQGNSSHYGPAKIGTIVIRVYSLKNENYQPINISRIIQPIHQSMEYADDFETEVKFDNWPNKKTSEEIREEEEILMIDTSGYIVSCYNCGREYISIPNTTRRPIEHNRKLVEDGKVTYLNVYESELVCSKCLGNVTIGEFLKKVDDKKKKDDFKNYLLNHIGLSKEENLFVGLDELIPPELKEIDKNIAKKLYNRNIISVYFIDYEGIESMVKNEKDFKERSIFAIEREDLSSLKDFMNDLDKKL